MVNLVKVLILVSPVLCQDILLPFEGNNEKPLQKCENYSDWTVVEFKNIGISVLVNFTVLLANNESCKNIPILLIAGSTLQCLVYAKTVYENSGTVIAVYLKDKELITKLSFKKADESLEDRWREISLRIEKSGVGYINLHGYSRDNETVLIDSVRYILNTTRTDVSTDKGFLINEEEVNLEQVVGKDFQKNAPNVKPNEKEKNNDFRAEGLKFSRDGNESKGFGSWAITLIVLGCLTVSALVAVSAYHIGKLVSRPEYPPIPLDDQTPNVVIIPRVRGTVDYRDNPFHEYI